MRHLSHHEHRQVITTGELMHRQVRRSARAEDRHRHRSFTVKSGDRQVITTGDRHRHRRAIVHSSSSQVKLWLITTRQADTGKFSLPETASYIVTIRSGRVRDRVTHKSAGKWSLPARKSCSCLSSWFGMGSDRRSTHHMYIIEFAIRGSVTAVTSLWDCSLFFSLIGWPREPRPRIAVGHGACIRPRFLPSSSPCRFTRNSRYPRMGYLTPIS